MIEMLITIAPFVGGALTLMILSYVYKESVFFTFAEHTFIGIYAGYIAVLGLRTIIWSGVLSLVEGDFTRIIPLVLGTLLLTRYTSKKYKPLSLWPVALLIGVGMALTVRGAMSTQIITQIIATLNPLVTGNVTQSLTNLLFLVMVASTITYFTFTREHKGNYGRVAYIGRISVLAALGSQYGNTVMYRLTLLLGRLSYLLTPPTYYTIPFAILLIAIAVVRDYRKRSINNTVE